eukprot:scaffold111635_cov22-Prasinocladus_malaysianus.AAC.1
MASCHVSRPGLLGAELDWSNAMFVGRDDYVVRSVGTRAGGKQLWNVTYSRLKCMDRNSLFTTPTVDNDHEGFANGSAKAFKNLLVAFIPIFTFAFGVVAFLLGMFIAAY